MAPLGVMDRSSNMNVNNDDAFLSLLSSQRELLNRLNMEGTTKKEQQSAPNMPQSNKRKRGSIIGPIDPLSLMNTSISAHHHHGTHLDTLFSQRLSVNIGSDFFALPPADSTYSFVDEEKMRDFDFSDPRRMKRRRSSLGLLSSMIFDDQQRFPNRRLSMLSTLSGSIGLADGFDCDSGFESIDPTPISTASVVQLDPRIPPEIVRDNLSSFASSMDNSTKSQQDIHAWDRKMGLKRSHSKTMRMTMRSRKKLRALLKKDINSLFQSSH